jgi:hypothetical protein
LGSHCRAILLHTVEFRKSADRVNVHLLDFLSQQQENFHFKNGIHYNLLTSSYPTGSHIKMRPLDM